MHKASQLWIYRNYCGSNKNKNKTKKKTHTQFMTEISDKWPRYNVKAASYEKQSRSWGNFHEAREKEKDIERENKL